MNIWVILAALGSFGAFIMSIALLIIGRHVANKIMYNDLAHLSADIKDIKDCILKYGERLDNQLERIATLEGRVGK